MDQRTVRPLIGFKDFYQAIVIIAGIESMHLIKKGHADFLKCLA